MEDEYHQLFMKRCIELARLGAGYTAPNPMVGALLVYKGMIAGEGYHHKFGEAHAEVNAINNTDQKILKDCTLYVSLEPCSHFGKTPPCADLIISSGIKKVIIGCTDPNPLVAGKGIEKMQNAGIDVVTGICENESADLNKRFFTAIRFKRPYIILKYAISADGFIGPSAAEVSKSISGEWSKRLVHQWRSEEAGIMVGTSTAVEDNPLLNSRFGSGPDPVRITFDRNYRIPAKHHLFTGTQETIIFTRQDPKSKFKNVSFLEIDFDQKDFLRSALQRLLVKGIQSILVEGGSKLLHEFYATGLWDETRLIRSQNSLHEGVKAPLMRGKYHLQHQSFLDKDLVQIYKNLEPAC
jgi:diaminohydroxyphosphoribosylaminopyrimidine deaminase/5-amino-6-(5-phosphoribosylamino)uracil reductase